MIKTEIKLGPFLLKWSETFNDLTILDIKDESDLDIVLTVDKADWLLMLEDIGEPVNHVDLERRWAKL